MLELGILEKRSIAMTLVNRNWKKYLYEFLVIFISVSLAFALAKWNEHKKTQRVAEKTLLEIKNGLKYDINDFHLNMAGHQRGIQAVSYFRKYLRGEPVRSDSIDSKLMRLLASYISIQNNSSYESLKAQGLDIIENDSLRLDIISLYDMSYEILIKLEENDTESQFHQNYYNSFVDILGEYFIFSEEGKLVDIKPPNSISNRNRNILYSHLNYIEKIKKNLIRNYKSVEKDAEKLMKSIEETMDD